MTLRLAVRVFETYPPSIVVLAIVAFIVTLSAGLEFGLLIASGVAVGHWLDRF